MSQERKSGLLAHINSVLPKYDLANFNAIGVLSRDKSSVIVPEDLQNRSLWKVLSDRRYTGSKRAPSCPI